jgi:phosphopantothenoylcysteine decarboxylase/phosphopantothenate--cysteine ligase
MFKGKKIVIGITGSIAAYKIPFLIRLLIREGAEVQVIMTPAAKDFVTPLTLSTLSTRPVIIDPFVQSSGAWNSHIEIGMWADVMLFAPVTANTLGKMVNGIADNFVVTAYLSARCPVFIAPAMDMDMYMHPSTRKNIDILRSYGNIIIEPQTGELASGLSGPGRLEDPTAILETLRSFFTRKKRFEGKKILVTAGPTYEAIDPVRFIGNHSSGKMGYAIANEAAMQGAEVTLISGPVSITSGNPNINTIKVTSAAEMHEAAIDNASSADVIIMAAAVADYRPSRSESSKIKKSEGNMTLELEPNPDILLELGKIKKNGQVLVGFALETENGVENATIKLNKKKLDLIVLNNMSDKGAGFNNDTNKVTLINADGSVNTGELKDKKEVASDILDKIHEILTKRMTHVI